MSWPMPGPFPSAPCAEPIARTVKSASAFADFDTGSSGCPFQTQSHPSRVM